MNDKQQAMPDVQGYADLRHVAITRVGIKSIRSPITVVDKRQPQHTVADFAFSVYLPEDRKGTHMSRFSQMLSDYRPTVYSAATFAEMYREMLTRLDSNAGTITVTFPYFIEKEAPVTKLKGMMDYNITLEVSGNSSGSVDTRVKIEVPVTTLCPCSKEISQYGAHSQRSVISIDALLSDKNNFSWEDVIASAEQQASAQLYSQLKRADEKFVTEHAYENPRFVEDLIREVAVQLNDNATIEAYVLEVENFESIHNHSAWARIEKQ
ncbi:GTP cyclohydrolase [Chromatiales bacterium (ex Bugula neritina AB1)]|nr:GTP cyclohydrolase [Chromatiales bacterium (ex Bugula neritina AB1)]